MYTNRAKSKCSTRKCKVGPKFQISPLTAGLLGSRVCGAARLLPASARSWRRQWDESSLPWQRSLSGLIWRSSKLIFRIRPVKCSWPFRPDLTAFKVHFLIRTYHVFLTVMTRLLWIPEVLFASEKSELSYFLFDLLILILFSFLLILILFSFSKEKIPSFLVSCPIGLIFELHTQLRLKVWYQSLSLRFDLPKWPLSVLSTVRYSVAMVLECQCCSPRPGLERPRAQLLPASARSCRRQWDESSLPWQRHLSGLIWLPSKLIFRIRLVQCSWPLRFVYCCSAPSRSYRGVSSFHKGPQV